eukprot:6474920-Amphidinium_carterae.1
MFNKRCLTLTPGIATTKVKAVDCIPAGSEKALVWLVRTVHTVLALGLRETSPDAVLVAKELRVCSDPFVMGFVEKMN